MSWHWLAWQVRLFIFQNLVEEDLLQIIIRMFIWINKPLGLTSSKLINLEAKKNVSSTFVRGVGLEFLWKKRTNDTRSDKRQEKRKAREEKK